MIWLLDSLEAIGINAIIFQVRPTADALYYSELEPTSHWLTGKQGGTLTWDPLEWTIQQAHQRNMEVHVWLNPYRVNLAKTDTSEICAEHVWRKHPEWFWEYNKQWYFDPGLDVTREWISGTRRDTRMDLHGRARHRHALRHSGHSYGRLFLPLPEWRKTDSGHEDLCQVSARIHGHRRMATQ